jgi:hypothetical protein
MLFRLAVSISEVNKAHNEVGWRAHDSKNDKETD